ncbi:patatin-like phospholipase family protein [Thalassolituus sp. LLYu03]|uniref:patatin-like phospholipase family protein n=1 Tax=Thalassolituus sp. LLYu03 TaxID=3421656 RepID=UPI003D2DC7CB
MSHNQTSAPKRALVLGCGAVAGGAWTIAALASVRRQLNWDPASADLLVGTSVGAVIAALLASGVSLDRLLAAQNNEPEDGCVWNHDTDSGGRLPPWPQWRFTSTALMRKALNREVRPLTGVCGLLPRGRTDMSGFERLIQSASADRWPEKKLWLMAVDAARGERRAFGRDAADAAQIPLSQAVCASYAVPGCCPPVAIQGATYLDGGIVSPVSADLLVQEDIDEVILLVPMASREPGASGGLINAVERYVRRGMTALVDREEAMLRAAGKRVIRIEPNADDLRAFGWNLLDPARRQGVFETALMTSPNTVADAIVRA